jgi:hypothetical protein
LLPCPCLQKNGLEVLPNRKGKTALQLSLKRLFEQSVEKYKPKGAVKTNEHVIRASRRQDGEIDEVTRNQK